MSMEKELRFLDYRIFPVLWRNRQKKSGRFAHIFQGMSKMRTVTALKAKRDEIVFSIRLYEDRIEQARADLAHVNAAIKVFEASGDPQEMGRYVDTHRMFRRGEPIGLCKAALAAVPKSTRELALHIMQSKGFDSGNAVLAKAVAAQPIHSPRMQALRGRTVRDGKKGAALVWRMP